MDKRLRSRYLSTTTYSYVHPETGEALQSLTDFTTPAASLFNANAAFGYKMSKPITDILLAADGTISFRFMGGGTSVRGVTMASGDEPPLWYDLNGRRLQGPPPQPGIYIVRYPEGTTKKHIR